MDNTKYTNLARNLGEPAAYDHRGALEVFKPDRRIKPRKELGRHMCDPGII